MNDERPQLMKRKLIAIMCGLLCLPACSSTIKDWSEEPDAVAPFYQGKPATVQRKTVSTFSAQAEKIRYRAGYRGFDREDTYQASVEMINKAGILGLIPGGEMRSVATGKTFFIPELFSDKRAFLVSMKPNILLLFPWQFNMDEKRSDGQPYLSYRSYRKQLTELHEQQKLFYTVQAVGPRSGDWRVLVELSPIFPDVEGIQAISDKWEGVRSLAEVNADATLPFKTELAPGMPGFRRLVLR